MDDSRPPRLHSLSDAFELATVQVFALIIGACAGVCAGLAWVDAVGMDGYAIAIPFAGVFAVGLSGVALALSVAAVGRFRMMWDDPKARLAIVAGLIQVLASGVVGIISGLVMTGWTIDIVTPLQTIVAWSGYGLLFAAAVQTASALVALIMLYAGRQLPDFLDE